MATDNSNSNENNITYDTELTPEEKQQVQEALKSLSAEDIQADEDFIKEVYGQADDNMSEVYTENKKNKESILDKISKVLLYYTIIDSVLKLTKRQEHHLFSSFSKTITDMFKSHSKLAQKTTENTLNKAFETISDKYNLKHSQMQRDKLVNQKYYGKHFSERIWDDEQKVAKAIQVEMKNFLKGKVNANQIAKRIQLKFDTNEYNAKRLTDTELSRIQNELFRQNCKKAGAKYVLYKATFCRTCKTCRAHHNITYKISNAPLIPLHPNCHCYYTIVDSPLKAMNLQLFGRKSDKDVVLQNISDGIISKSLFDESLSYFNQKFKVGIQTPIEVIKNKNNRYYHIIAGHPDLLGKEEINNIINTLKTPDKVKKTFDKNGRESIGYLKEIDGMTLLVIAKNDIITAYYPGKNYLKNKVESWDTIWQKK